MSPATIIIGIVILLLLALSLRRITKKGSCDCAASKSEAGGCNGACAHCLPETMAQNHK